MVVGEDIFGSGTTGATSGGYTYEDIKKEIRETMPDEADFVGIYTEDEVREDLNRVEQIRREMGIVDNGEISDSRVQEYITAQEITINDWFMEDVRDDLGLKKDERGERCSVFLTSNFDDYVNHIDAICVIQNALTNFHPLPFALDMTYNTEKGKLSKKMYGWKYPDKSLAVPGLAVAKYFQDDFHLDPILSSGPIGVMPRFVVGYNPDLSSRMTEVFLSGEQWNSATEDALTAQARNCVLQELVQQSDNLAKLLEGRQAGNRLAQLAYVQTTCLQRYFKGAETVARERDLALGHQGWQTYPNRDQVCQAILNEGIRA